MLIEAWRAARNEHAQRARGGVEPPGDVYKLMRIVYPGAFLAMFAEGVARVARRRVKKMRSEPQRPPRPQRKTLSLLSDLRVLRGKRRVFFTGSKGAR